MPLFKPISTSLSPNVQWDDVLLTIKLLIKELYIARYTLSATSQLEQEFREYLGIKYSFSVNSGRSALFVILKTMGIQKGDEVLLQAFTCNAVPNPVLWLEGTPVFVDTDESLNIDPQDLEGKITAHSKAVIIQNTFGVPAQMDKILEIARRHNLVVIEDCAHALGAEYHKKKVGTFGDVAFFSFGRDKVISSVWGGMITTNRAELAQKIETLHHDLSLPSTSWTIRQLLHPLLFSIIIPSYYVFGKYFLAMLRAGRGISLAVSAQERMGERPDMFPKLLPNALAALALHQFGKLERYNQHRRKIAELYRENLDSNFWQLPPKIDGSIYLRFNILHPNAKMIIQQAKKKHLLLGDWYKNVIDPIGTDFQKMQYTAGSCPNAERAARESINLSTHINISAKNAKQVIKYLQNHRPE